MRGYLPRFEVTFESSYLSPFYVCPGAPLIAVGRIIFGDAQPFWKAVDRLSIFTERLCHFTNGLLFCAMLDKPSEEEVCGLIEIRKINCICPFGFI